MDRKAAAAAYKERTVEAGVYAVRCPSAGRAWVGLAPDLSTIWNRIAFTLKQGSHPHRTLQPAWRERAGEGFTFEVLEAFDRDAPPTERARRARLAHWAAALGADRL